MAQRDDIYKVDPGTIIWIPCKLLIRSNLSNELYLHDMNEILSTCGCNAGHSCIKFSYSLAALEIVINEP